MAGVTFPSSRSSTRWRSPDPYRFFELIYEYVIVLGGALIWTLGGLSLTCAAVVGLFLEKGSFLLVGRGLLRRLFRLFLWYLERSGLVSFQFDHLLELAKRVSRSGTEPLIIAPNHPSLLDAIFIMAYVPNVTCIMKASLMRNLFLRGGAQLAGFIQNDSPKALVEQSVIALRRGSSLLIFPEGTRTRTDADQVGRFKGGVALIASITGLPVQPVYFRSNSHYLSKGWPIHRLPEFPLAYSACVDAPMRLERGEKVRAFLDRMEVHYRRVLQSAVK